MTEDEAKARIATVVPRETFTRLEQLVELITHENGRQNLVSPGSLSIMWNRHILDSAQLVWLVKNLDGAWLDIGTGAGFPGLVVALLRPLPTILVEPRAKRATFLKNAAEALGVSDHVRVVASKLENSDVAAPIAVVSARAVASLPALFGMASRYTASSTVWLLPKGRSAADEVAEARREWQGEMKLVPSLSDPESAIVVASGVKRKRG